MYIHIQLLFLHQFWLLKAKLLLYQMGKSNDLKSEEKHLTLGSFLSSTNEDFVKISSYPNVKSYSFEILNKFSTYLQSNPVIYPSNLFSLCITGKQTVFNMVIHSTYLHLTAGSNPVTSLMKKTTKAPIQNKQNQRKKVPLF